LAADRIDIALKLQSSPPGALTAHPFLGGVLHGVLSAHWHAGLRGGEAGMSSPTGAPARFRLLAPPAQAAVPAPWLSGDGTLTFAVLWYSDSAWPAVRAAAALQAARWLGAGSERHRILRVDTRVSVMDPPHLGDLEPEADLGWRRVRIRWLTPVHLVSRARTEAGFGNLPPRLFNLLRSLAQRARALEPAWARRWDIGGESWVRAELPLRAAELLPGRAWHDTHTLVWRYGSRTKARPFERRGLLGEQQFLVPLTAAQAALLTVGQWLGAGEGLSFGCGAYALQIDPRQEADCPDTAAAGMALEPP